MNFSRGHGYEIPPGDTSRPERPVSDVSIMSPNYDGADYGAHEYGQHYGAPPVGPYHDQGPYNSNIALAPGEITPPGVSKSANMVSAEEIEMGSMSRNPYMASEEDITQPQRIRRKPLRARMGRGFAGQEPYTQVDSIGAPPPLSRNTTLQKMGRWAIFVLIGSLLLLMAMMSFITFLWFSSHTNLTWHAIMVKGYATRAVSLTSLVIRFAVDSQAGICTSMLAALALEAFIVPLPNAARVSSLRSVNTSPYELVIPIYDGLFRSTGGGSKSHRTLSVPILLVFIVITTSLSQLCSTALLSDLRITSIIGFRQTTINNAYGFFVPQLNENDKPDRAIFRGSTWFMKPFLYPVFAEYTEPPVNITGVVDTGVTLRAFLPLVQQATREVVRNYTGKATVVDTRVTCQIPDLLGEKLMYGASTNGVGVSLTGNVSSSTFTPRLHNTTVYPYTDSIDGLGIGVGVLFECEASIGNGTLSLCQLDAGGSDGSVAWSGGLTGEFRPYPPVGINYPWNFTKSGNAYMVINITQGTSQQWASAIDPTNGTYPRWFDTHDEWLDLFWSNGEVRMSITLCYTAYDTADLKIQAFGPSNRTEPMPVYDFNGSAYTYEAIRQQLDVRRPLDLRPVMSMAKRDSWFPDDVDNVTGQDIFPFLTQASDMSNSLGLLSGNYTAFLVEGTSGVLSSSSSTTDTSVGMSVIPDSSHTILFKEVVNQTGSVAHGIQALLTVFAGMTYYDQILQFDKFDNSTQIAYLSVLTPTEVKGFWSVLGILCLHLILVTLITYKFVSESKLTVLGNAWEGVSQLFSDETKDVIAHAGDRNRRAGTGSDANLWKNKSRILVGVTHIEGSEKAGITSDVTGRSTGINVQ